MISLDKLTYLSLYRKNLRNTPCLFCKLTEQKSKEIFYVILAEDMGFEMFSSRPGGNAGMSYQSTVNLTDYNNSLRINNKWYRIREVTRWD